MPANQTAPCSAEFPLMWADTWNTDALLLCQEVWIELRHSTTMSGLTADAQGCNFTYGKYPINPLAGECPSNGFLMRQSTGLGLPRLGLQDIVYRASEQGAV